MEHRHYPRMQVSLEVDLYKRDQHLGHAQTKDISLGGMTLNNQQPLVKNNDLINMRLWINGEAQVMRGLVIHTDHQSAGVMLIDMDKEVTRNFFSFLQEMKVPLHSALGLYDQET
jgi:hypothetical protein